MDDTRTPIISIDCWHHGCDFHELMEGVRLEGICTQYLSSDKLWSEHNRKVHGRG